MTPAQLVDAFMKVWVAKFQTARGELGGLYEEASSYSFEGTTVKGKAAISAALTGNPIPAGSAIRLITTDLQPSPSAGAFVVMVTGEIATHKYQQLFQLVPKAGGSYYVHNDMFRAGTANPDNAPADVGGDVVKPFVTTYYKLFDTARASLAVVYSAASTFTFEKNVLTGQDAIIKYLATLPGTTHKINTIDLQSVSGDTKVLLVFVTGEVTIEGSTNPLKFCQAFQLIHNGTTYYVHNDLFRLNYG